MKSNSSLRIVAFIAILPIILALPQDPIGATASGGMPAFSDFVSGVVNGHAEIIRGVYVPGILAFPVVQQPANDPQAVSEDSGVITQFGQAAQNHVIGLLAHNTLAGAFFYGLGIGQEIRIVYGDGRVDYYVVNNLSRFKVIHPGRQDIGYMDLSTDRIYNTQDLFAVFYRGKAHVTFQTCIQQDGDLSWGRFFVTAVPVPKLYFRELDALGLSDLQKNRAILSALEFISGNANLR